jgi:hypothetical protein
VKLPKENGERESRLLKLIASGDAVLMVGAGLSKIIGYPLRYELLEYLEKNVPETSPRFNLKSKKEDLLVYADRLKKALGE